jgi:nitronate monooxygenase
VRAKSAGADVVVAQGSDAGGHGNMNSASIISLVPELVTVLPGTPILAAGGISEGRSVLAALALGAEGVVMGTKFAVSVESAMAEPSKSTILRTCDGGISTRRFPLPVNYGFDSRTRVFDDLEHKAWGAALDGRAIVNETLKDYDRGVGEIELRRRYDAAFKDEDYTRLDVFAGTGVGLVTNRQTVAEILDDVEGQILGLFKRLNKSVSRL